MALEALGGYAIGNVTSQERPFQIWRVDPTMRNVNSAYTWKSSRMPLSPKSKPQAGISISPRPCAFPFLPLHGAAGYLTIAAPVQETGGGIHDGRQRGGQSR